MSEIQKEKAAISNIENYYIRDPGETEILLDDLDLAFSRTELTHIKSFWLEGVNLPQIAKTIERDQDEVFLALFHLARSQRKDAKNDKIILKVSQILGG